MLRLYIIISLLFTGILLTKAQRVFEINSPDKKISPLTGMTRAHWQDAALYLLEGAFAQVKENNDVLLFPIQPGKSYPRDGKRGATEMLEGLCRTLFIAAPVLKDKPNLKIGHISLAEYYRHQIVLLSDKRSPSYIAPLAKNGGPSQTLVEFGGLAISLMMAPEILWDPLAKEDKDQLASLMLSYGEGPTIDMNWRFFNVFVLSFFKSKGYAVNEAKLEDLIQKLLKDYTGNGWYSDSPFYDYYSMWAFQMYGVLWADMFGKEYYPVYASQFMQNLSELAIQYPFMFAEDGKMIMYGRSIAYRMGAAAPFPLMGLLKGSKDINYGWIRRIASGALLQFLQHPDFLKDGVPTLGFYGPFEPAVQQYSCRASAYWLGKIFLTGLYIPKDNIFWTAKENNGAWEDEIKKEKLKHHFAEGSNILISNYADIGGSEIRSWCNSPKMGYYEGTENYNKLAYHTAFPWQADGLNGNVSMNYAISSDGEKWEVLRLYEFTSFKDAVYRREARLASDLSVQFRLTDYIVNNGVLRVDTVKNANGKRITFGHYALPEFNGKAIIEFKQKIGNYNFTIIDNGIYQLALASVQGSYDIKVVKSSGLHPEAQNSAVIQISSKVDRDEYVFKTVLLWKKSGQKWSSADLKNIKLYN